MTIRLLTPARGLGLAVLFVAAVLGTAQARQQVTVGTADDVIVVMPQNSQVIWDPRHSPRHPPMPRPVPAPVKLTTVAADVQVNDQVATTTLVMTLSNAGGVPQEAQLLVPVPDGATIRSFQLDSLGPEPTARLLPRAEARRIYDSIVSKMRDPGLLEFVNFSLIRSSVFPIPANGTNTVRLTYELLLSADGDRIDYVLPRTESLEPSGVSWTLSMEIRSTRPLSTVYSPSHDIVTERIDAHRVTVKATAETAANPGSFRVSYLLQPTGKNGVAATLLTYPDPELGEHAGYFLLLAGLPATRPEDHRPVKREVTIVIDRSGSMRGQKMDQAREAARQVVEGLEDGEYFNIIDYSDSIASFADKPVARSADTIAQARSYLTSLKANGGTNIHDALIEALRQDPTPGTLPVVLFLTDGLPTVGQTGEVAIREAAAKANTSKRRIFAFGVGFDVNAPLLTGVARGTRGTSTFVLPDENVEVKVSQVFRRLSGPILAEPAIAAIGPDGKTTTRAIREVQPGALPDLFEGDQLVLLGQYTGAAGQRLTLRLDGSFLGEQRSFEFAFDTARATTRNSYVPRLWATRKVAALIEEIRQAGANGASPGSPPTTDPRTKELVEEIVRLSIRWGILTEYTAFLATEAEYAGGGRADLGDIVRYRDVTRLGMPYAPAPAARAAQVAEGELRLKAVQARAGVAAVNQDVNLGVQVFATCENKLNSFYDEKMNRINVTSVCQVADRTLFKRGTRWVDARILDKEAEAPEATIEFASDAYRAIVEFLARENRQGLLALGGDVYLLHEGRRVLVKGPGEPE